MPKFVPFRLSGIHSKICHHYAIIAGFWNLSNSQDHCARVHGPAACILHFWSSMLSPKTQNQNVAEGPESRRRDKSTCSMHLATISLHEDMRGGIKTQSRSYASGHRRFNSNPHSILCISKDVWGIIWIKMNHDIYYRMSIPTLEYPSLDRSAIVSTRPRTRAADLIIWMHGISVLQPLKGCLQKGPFTILTITVSIIIFIKFHQYSILIYLNLSHA